MTPQGRLRPPPEYHKLTATGPSPGGRGMDYNQQAGFGGVGGAMGNQFGGLPGGAGGFGRGQMPPSAGGYGQAPAAGFGNGYGQYQG